MKKIIYLMFLVSIAFSKTGNDFLNEYPFDKKTVEMNDAEMGLAAIYLGITSGVIAGNVLTIEPMRKKWVSLYFEVDENKLNNVLDRFSFTDKIPDGLDNQQLIRMVKKYCDENPEETHNEFVFLLHLVIHRNFLMNDKSK